MTFKKSYVIQIIFHAEIINSEISAVVDEISVKLRLRASIATTGTITPYDMRQCDCSDVPFQDIS